MYISLKISAPVKIWHSPESPIAMQNAVHCGKKWLQRLKYVVFRLDLRSNIWYNSIWIFAGAFSSEKTTAVHTAKG